MFRYEETLVGADPELFFVNANGQPVSAEGKLGGSKENPKPFGQAGAGYFIQEDNVAAEFNIPPCRNGRDFSNSINKALKYVSKIAKDLKLEPAYVASLHFSEKDLSTPHARRLGCDPDYNVWAFAQNPAPIVPPSLRTAAGHVHVGWKEPTNKEREVLLKALDLFLGIPSILATEKNDRRNLYGKAGACRIKPYGVEYRVLDNFWIKDHENRLYVFDQIYSAVQTIRAMGGETLLELLNDHRELIVNTINDHDYEQALNLVNRFNLTMFPKFNG